MRILVFDNYDSFTYNLVHLVEKITHGKTDVFRNDQIPLEKVKEYDKIILSPGPGLPSAAGLLLPLVKAYSMEKSILGVCLGHQAIAEAFGGKLVNLDSVFHGVATKIRVGGSEKSKGESEKWESESANKSPGIPGIVNSPLFEGLPNEFEVGRYHSWVVSPENFPEELEVTALDENQMIMGLQHKNFDVQGVQFHPESVLTPSGEDILRNWLKR